MTPCLKKITMTNFRNFSRAAFFLDPRLTVIVGPNAVGKTNLLEAIYFVLRGCGFREDKEEELVQIPETMLSVEAELTLSNELTRSYIRLEREPKLVKSYVINKVKKRLQEYARQMTPVAIFSPSFLYIADGQMQERRGFFDHILERIDFEYKRRRLSYEQILRKRNKLLETIIDKEKLSEQLVFWDEQLIKEAQYIGLRRQELVAFFNQYPKLDRKTFFIDYLKNEVSCERLAATFDKQCVIKKTLVGPQRDVFEFYIDEKNVHKFGSRSEQRLTLFWLTFNQINLYQKHLKKQPLVLLDDVFSELDLANKSLIVKLIKDCQTVLTTVEEDFVDHIDLPKRVIRL